MAATLTPERAPNANPPWHWRARTGLARVGNQAAQMASAARHRLRRPALVISGLGCMDAAAWTSFGLGAGLVALGASLWVFELVTGADE